MKKLSFIFLVLLTVIACKKDDDSSTSNNTPNPSNNPPTASFTVTPNTGDTQTNFQFDASGSTDNEDANSSLQVRWDFETDGIWDVDWTSAKVVNHQYNQQGNYNVTLEVKDSEGLSDSDSESITVSGGGTGQPCPGTPTVNFQGQVYNTVEIGNQCWFKENLNYETGNSWCYDNDPNNCNTYGRLYNWATLMNGEASSTSVPSGVQGICPSGWHVPSDKEWTILTDFLGGNSVAGGKMKSTSGWYNNGNGSNSSGFSALPGGYRNDQFIFLSIEKDANFWSSTEYGSNIALKRYLNYYYDEVYPYGLFKNYGYSVRCVQD